MTINNGKKLLDEIRKEREKTEELIKEFNSIIADIDKRYAQAIVKDGLNTIKNYKKILARESTNN